MTARWTKESHALNPRIGVALLACIVGGLLILASCGKKETKIDPAKYEGWKLYSYGHFDIHYNPRSSWATQMAELARGYERFLTEICSILEMPVPEDKIDLYIYLPGPEGKEITGRVLPFSTATAIHWDAMYPYGYQLTKFLLAKKGIEPGDFRAMNEGVPHLLDFSGINYHDKTNRLVNSGKFVPLVELGDNNRFDSLAFPIKRAEAASLCGFIMYNYGLERLFMLWNSSVGWQRSIETIFQTPIDEFEKKWLEFARANTTAPEGTMDNDSVQDLRMIIQ